MVSLYQFQVTGSTQLGRVDSEIVHAVDALYAMDEFTKEYKDCSIEHVSIFNGKCWQTVYGLEHINPALLNEQAH